MDQQSEGNHVVLYKFACTPCTVVAYASRLTMPRAAGWLPALTSATKHGMVVEKFPFVARSDNVAIFFFQRTALCRGRAACVDPDWCSSPRLVCAALRYRYRFVFYSLLGARPTSGDQGIVRQHGSEDRGRNHREGAQVSFLLFFVAKASATLDSFFRLGVLQSFNTVTRCYITAFLVRATKTSLVNWQDGSD